MIEVNNLVKYYGNYPAVNKISFSLSEGKIYGLLGPNGAGKSTTMNIITGYIGATSGSVKINGFDILEEPEKAKKNIGYLPEIPPLFKDMTVDEYLLFVAELKGVKRAERRNHVDEIEEKTFVSDVAYRLIKHLSKGYRQRVGLAAAIISYPKVIILDEPTVGLDPKQINEMRELIISLKKNHTVILSSHIMQEVAAVCDELLIISKGTLIARGTPQELEKLQNKGTVITYKLKGQKEAIEEVIHNDSKISSYEISENNGHISVSLSTSLEPDEALERFYLLFAEKKIIILESNALKNSLEDLFLSIVSNDKEDE
ncbi:MAG: ABC transporter ATP-binding protein [Clostridiales bacterium]|nr:ABC transporter ATP-binding protein [Clostridiales bacterium]